MERKVSRSDVQTFFIGVRLMGYSAAYCCVSSFERDIRVRRRVSITSSTMLGSIVMLSRDAELEKVETHRSLEAALWIEKCMASRYKHGKQRKNRKQDTKTNIFQRNFRLYGTT